MGCLWVAGGPIDPHVFITIISITSITSTASNTSITSITSIASNTSITSITRTTPTEEEGRGKSDRNSADTRERCSLQ
jgi:hypothetical protein